MFSRTGKEKKVLRAVEERRASFTPFVVSLDGVLGHDAQHLMKRLCDQIAMKWEKSHSEVMGWVHARMAFAILRATNLCLGGSRVKWRSGYGMGMMEPASLIFLTDVVLLFTKNVHFNATIYFCLSACCVL